LLHVRLSFFFFGSGFIDAWCLRASISVSNTRRPQRHRRVSLWKNFVILRLSSNVATFPDAVKPHGLSTSHSSTTSNPNELVIFHWAIARIPLSRRRADLMSQVGLPWLIAPETGATLRELVGMRPIGGRACLLGRGKVADTAAKHPPTLGYDPRALETEPAPPSMSGKT